MIKPALRIETAKATIPAKSIKSEKIRAYPRLRMQKTIKNIEKVMISMQKLMEIHSTTVENSLQIRLFLQNKPNFPRFSTENEDLTQKQTQFKAKTNPICEKAKNELKSIQNNEL